MFCTSTVTINIQNTIYLKYWCRRVENGDVVVAVSLALKFKPFIVFVFNEILNWKINGSNFNQEQRGRLLLMISLDDKNSRVGSLIRFVFLLFSQILMNAPPITTIASTIVQTLWEVIAAPVGLDLICC